MPPARNKLEGVGGIDPSLAGTGIVILDSCGHLLHHERIATGPEQELEERLALIKRRVKKALVTHNVKRVAIESLAIHPSSPDSRPWMVVGVLRLLVWSLKISQEAVAPNSLKLEAAGHGRASKAEMLDAARELWPGCPNHDEADAFHLARHLLRNPA